jgi:Tol biopolymer transport system component
MQGLPLWGDIQWNFSISQVLLAYLHPFGESADLYTLDLETGQKDKVTQSGWVVGYDVILSGMRLYFSILNAEGGSSLMEYDRLAEESSLLLDCGADLCSDPRVSFDESWLAFERMPKNGVPHIWIYDLKTGVSNQVSRSGNHAQSPKWSSQGVLSFYDFDQQAYVLYSPSESEQNLISNQTGASIAWSPEGTEIIIPELFPVSLDVLRGPTGEASLEEVPVEELEPVQVFTSHLIKTVIASGVVADLTQDNTLEDASPVYSPDGTWIAFGRRSIDEQDWIPGRQLWLMRSNGEDAHMLTNSPDYKYTAFAWHPDGSRIAYVRANQTDLTALVELWVIKTDGSDPTRLVIGGYAPQWIP